MTANERVMERMTTWSAVDRATGTEVMKTVRPMIRLFISHATEDRPLAATMIDLIRESVDIDREEIRCTSVPGYGLDIARHIPTALREELEDATIVLAVITRASLKSAWAMMEVGVGWAQGTLWVVLDDGIRIDEIPAPLRDYQILRLSEKSDLVRLTSAIAERLGRRTRGGESAADIFLQRRGMEKRDEENAI